MLVLTGANESDNRAHLTNTVNLNGTMSHLEDMRMLIETLDCGSFSAAAKRLGLSKQFVSRRITTLEARLGAQLLIRTTRSLSPTDLGKDYATRARRILADVQDAESAIASHLIVPRGTLRVSAPLSFGLAYLSPLLPRFMTEAPNIKIDLELNDRQVDLINEGFDMAIRIGSLPDSSLVARKIMDVHLSIVATPAYLERRGTPNVVSDLKSHDCLMFRHSQGSNWFFNSDGREISVPVAGPLCTNNGEVVRDAALAGLGLAQLPRFLTEDAIGRGSLVSVMESALPIGGGCLCDSP